MYTFNALDDFTFSDSNDTTPLICKFFIFDDFDVPMS